MEDRESFNEERQNLENSHLKTKRPFFSCSLCHEKYKSPKVLICWHSFCLECLSSYIPENSISVVCPVCNIPSILPKQGINFLPDNWMLTLMKDGKSSSVDLLTLKTSSRMLDTIGGNETQVEPQFETVNNNISSDNNYNINISSNNNNISNTNNNNNNISNTNNNKFDTNNINGIFIKDGVHNTFNIESLTSKHSEEDSDSPSHNSALTSPFNKDTHSTSRQHYHDHQCDTASSSAIVMDESLTGETSQSPFFSQSYRSSSEFSNEKLYCRLHPLQNLELYCHMCDVALCLKCSENGHGEHELVSIDLAIQNQKTTFMNLLEELKYESKDTENDKNFIERIKHDLESSCNKVKDQINTRYSTIMSLLQKKLNSNLQDLDYIYNTRNDVLDKQLVCINENFENIQISYDLAEKIVDSDRSELILLANKSYAFEEYDVENRPTDAKSNSFVLSRPIESSFICFDPESYENLEKYSTYLNGIISDKSLCSNMISFSNEDLNKAINLNRKCKLAVYLIEDNACIVNDYLSRLNKAIHIIIFLPNGRKKPAEFVKDTSNNKLGYMQFTPDQIGIHTLEMYNFGVLVRGTPLELKVTNFSLASTSTSNHFNHFPISKTKTSAPKRQVSQIQTKLKAVSSVLLNKNLAISQPHNSNALKSSVKTSMIPSQRQKSNSSLSRPPWNHSINRAHKLVPTTQPLKRSLSSTVPRTDLSHRLSNNSLHKLDKTAKLNSRISSHPVINKSFKERINNDCKINFENKIVEEEDLEIQDLNQKVLNSKNQNGSYCHLHNNAHNKTLPLSKTMDLKPKRRTTTLPHNTPRTTRQVSNAHKIIPEKINTSKTNLKFSSDLIKKYGCKGKRLGEFNSLQDVAFYNGLIIASDAKNQCLQVVDHNSGQFTKQISLQEAFTKISSPSGVAVDASGFMYVSDLNNHCVVVLDPRGRVVKRIGANNLKGPKGLALSDKELIVTDMKGCSIHIYDKSNGELLGSFGNQGYKDENLCSPQFCALTLEQTHIIVSDFRTDRVKIFSREGQLMQCFGSSGTRAGQLSGPTGLAVHPVTGNIFVCDFSNNRIQVFSKEGKYLEKLNVSLSAPQGISFLNDGTLMVADAGNHCIKLTKIKQTVQ